MAKPRKPDGKALDAVRPNAGIEAKYRRQMQALLEEMARSVVYRVKAAYRKHEPLMVGLAADAAPAKEIQDVINDLSVQWQKRLNEAAPRMAKAFVDGAGKVSSARLKRILRDAGMTVDFKLTRTLRDVMTASVEANVQLIKSIPEQFLGQVQGAVMRSVSTGRDLGGLTKELQKQFGVGYRRASFIAHDQNNKATSAIQKARQVELGLDQGVWLHSHGGKEPRPTHLANHGKTFSIVEGWFDPDPRVRKRIMPGELPRCRCVWKVVVKGFS